jgi:hypothetical protein
VVVAALEEHLAACAEPGPNGLAVGIRGMERRVVDDARPFEHADQHRCSGQDRRRSGDLALFRKIDVRISCL